MFTGERLFRTAVIAEAGSVLVVPMPVVITLIGSDPEWGDVIMQTVLARRDWLMRQRTGFRIVGSCYSPDTGRLREFAARDRLPHVWINLDEDPSAQSMLEDAGAAVADTPIVVLPDGGVLTNPSNAEPRGRSDWRSRPNPRRYMT